MSILTKNPFLTFAGSILALHMSVASAKEAVATTAVNLTDDHQIVKTANDSAMEEAICKIVVCYKKGREGYIDLEGQWHPTLQDGVTLPDAIELRDTDSIKSAVEREVDGSTFIKLRYMKGGYYIIHLKEADQHNVSYKVMRFIGIPNAEEIKEAPPEAEDHFDQPEKTAEGITIAV